MAGDTNVVAFSNTKSKSNCTQCGRASHCFGRYLSAANLAHLNTLEVNTRLLHRGDRLFQSGTSFETLYIIKAGHIKTTLLSEDGEEHIIGFYSSGDILGLEGIASGNYACNAIALDTCSICSIHLDQAMHSLGHEPAFAMNIIKLMSENLLRDGRMLLTLGKKDAQQRMATFLLAQARAQAQRGFSGRVFNLAMPRADIGNHLNLAVETVSRLLTRFKQQGLICVDRNQVELLDMDKLASLSGDQQPQALSSPSAALH